MTESTAGAPETKRVKTAPQTGILNRPPEHLLLIALNIVGDPRTAIEALRSLVQQELTSSIETLGDPSVPPAETGELGFEAHHDRAHLTITVGFASTAYDKLAIAKENQPADLVPIPWSAFDDTPADAASGDILLQICADSTFITEHVLRRIEHSLAGQLTVQWAHTGVQRYNSRQGRTARREGRAWIGFIDGTSNLDPTKNKDDYALTFVDPNAAADYPRTPVPGQPSPYAPTGPRFPDPMREFVGAEPAWTRDGSYLVARLSNIDLSTWDNTALAEQEHTVGRTKQQGLALDVVDQAGATDQTVPAFAQNQSDTRVAVDAHIRKANPRGGDEDLKRRIFRRGYPLYEGSDGTLRRGLIFLCFARTISTQFEFIFRGWLTNPNFPIDGGNSPDLLRRFETQVLAGGYYFVPPLDVPHEPWSWHVPS